MDHDTVKAADLLTKSVIVGGCRLMEREAAIYGNPEDRFNFRLTALNQVLFETQGGRCAPIRARDLAAVELIALGKHIARASDAREVLCEAVKTIGQLAKVTALTEPAAADVRIDDGREGVNEREPQQGDLTEVKPREDIPTTEVMEAADDTATELPTLIRREPLPGRDGTLPRDLDEAA